jgi:hypothetical protein
VDTRILPLRERGRRQAAPGERPARAALRDQIARLERSLAGHVCDGFPVGIPAQDPAGASAPGAPLPSRAPGARLQTLAELEQRRDALSARVSDVRKQLDARGAQQQLYRGRLEAIMLDPAAHPWERVTNADIGEPGCRQYHARPRFGILGMMLDWWRIRISSGCPLCMPAQDCFRLPCTAPRSQPSSSSAA